METKIREQLDIIKFKKIPVLIRNPRIEPIYESFLKDVNERELILINTVPPTDISAFMRATEPFTVQCQNLKMTAKHVSTDGKHLVFSLDEMVSNHAEKRDAERYVFDESEQVSCQFINPIDEETLLQFPIYDLSHKGASFISKYDSLLFSHEMPLLHFSIFVGANLYQQHAAKVVYKKRIVSYQKNLRIQVGVAFT